MQHLPNKPTFSKIVKNNPSGYILRTKLSEQTGGLLHGRTMANLDSLGRGIPGRITISNRKVAYPVEAVVEYLQSKVTVNRAFCPDSCTKIMESKGESS